MLDLAFFGTAFVVWVWVFGKALDDLMASLAAEKEKSDDG